ncbi:MAG TPA: hypothetical protein VG122_10460 [Gemmata sp.]|nr:hypothetical protein [Gemmata sp.]
MRHCWLLLGVFGAFGTIGCASWRQPAPATPDVLVSAEPSTPPNVATQTVSPTPQTEVGNSVPTVRVETTLVETTGEGANLDQSDDSLTLVDESLERGDKIAAASHLETYVRQHPDQAMFRLQLAELLLQIKSDARAKVHFEQFVAKAQTATEPVRKYLVHAHTRLMEIGERTDDPFAELFHRGVGLLILVQEQDKTPDRDEGFCEEMLCKALRALNEARERNPGDPRVRVYLAGVYERMGNRRGAATERSAARNGVVPGELTPGEQSHVLIRGL